MFVSEVNFDDLCHMEVEANERSRQLWRRLVAVNKSLLVAVILFVITEFLCVVSLFSSEWITSNNIGSLTLSF